MSAEGEPLERPALPLESRPHPGERWVHPATRPGAQGQIAAGAVMCLFDGSPAALSRLRLAAASAVAARRRLIVAHVEAPGTGFWAAAFTGYGACLGPPDGLFSSTAEMAFAAAVEGLIGSAAGWDFVSCRASRSRALREMTTDHEAAVVIVDSRRLARRLARDGALTVLVL